MLIDLIILIKYKIKLLIFILSEDMLLFLTKLLNKI